MQIIFHIDLNAFFANAEISMNPSLKGKPLVISHDSRRSIVSTASYEARKFGIHSAMPTYKAKELCPDLIMVPPNFKLYKHLSNQFFEIIASFSPLLEVASIDECYVDMTEYIQKSTKSIEEIARMIQQKVYNDLSLECSIGVAPNKFLAKMASDLKKPMGITIITNSNYKEKIWNLPIGEMYGIGKKTAPKLMELGIKTIGDLAKYKNYEITKSVFGKNALIYYQRANGKDFSKMHYEHNELKSVGHSTTFEHDSNDEVFIKSMLRQLSLDVSMRAKKHNLVSNTICITLKYTREKSRTKQMIIDKYTNEFDDIYATTVLLLESVYHGEMLRLVGVSINNVVKQEDVNVQISLFEPMNEQENKEVTVDDIISNLNDKFKSNTFKKASDLVNNKGVQSKYLKHNND
jgi:DNA polymerase-4